MYYEACAAFRRRLRAGETLIGSGVSFTDPLVSEALADSVDFLFLDMEHSAMSPEALRAHLLAARSRQVLALVRVAEGITNQIKPVLDAGAPAIVVPQVCSVETVRAAVADCRYPPIGRRGFGPRVPMRFGRTPVPDHVADANQGVLVVAMIETVEAVRAIEQIVRVDGLDSIFIGPMDLSASLGHLGQLDHPAVAAAIDTTIAAARAADMPVGMGLGTDVEAAAAVIRRGVQWLQVGGDFRYMIVFFEQMAAAIRAAGSPGRGA